MSNSRKGNRRKAVQDAGPRGRKMYEWGSEVLHDVSIIMLFATIALVVATVLIQNNNDLQVVLVSAAVALFGVIEFVRVIDNQAKGGNKKDSIVFGILGGALVLAGILMALFIVVL